MLTSFKPVGFSDTQAPNDPASRLAFLSSQIEMNKVSTCYLTMAAVASDDG